MRPHGVRLGVAIAAAFCVAAVTALLLLSGSGSSEQVVGGSARVVMATPPDYLDPQLAYTTEGAGADWIAYTPLLTYRHKSGADGTELILQAMKFEGALGGRSLDGLRRPVHRCLSASRPRFQHD